MHDTIDTDVLANRSKVTPKVDCLTLDTVAGIIVLVASRLGQCTGNHHEHSTGGKDMIPNAQIKDEHVALHYGWTCSTHPVADAVHEASYEVLQ